MNKRPLTAKEKQFVAEAETSGMTVDYKMDGTPYALGADKNTRCFTDEVTEDPDGDGGATYWLS